jgi:hypothetical protein
MASSMYRRRFGLGTPGCRHQHRLGSAAGVLARAPRHISCETPDGLQARSLPSRAQEQSNRIGRALERADDAAPHRSGSAVDRCNSGLLEALARDEDRKLRPPASRISRPMKGGVCAEAPTALGPGRAAGVRRGAIGSHVAPASASRSSSAPRSRFHAGTLIPTRPGADWNVGRRSFTLGFKT